MNEFKLLLESELLSDETKDQLKEAVETFKKTVIEEARKELETEYAEKFVAEKQEISKKLFDVVTEAVEEEIAELKEDIIKYKDLEINYATKLEDFKTEYSEKLSESFEVLVDSQIKEEFVELKEDLTEAKKNHFGIEIFESFKNTFDELGFSEDDKSIKDDLKEAKEELSKKSKLISVMERKEVMDELLDNLNGSKKEVMKTILENVETSKLEDRYNEVIDSVLKESSDNEIIKESVSDKDDLELSVELDRLKRLIN